MQQFWTRARQVLQQRGLMVPLGVLLAIFVIAGLLRLNTKLQPHPSPHFAAATLIVVAFVLGVGLRPVMIRRKIWPGLIRVLDLLFSSAAEYRALAEELKARLRTRRNQLRRLKQKLRQQRQHPRRRHNDQRPPGDRSHRFEDAAHRV